MNRLKWKLKRCEDVEKNDDWNIKYLKENGIIVFIDRPLNNIKKDVDIS